ncbi:SHC-transforming protein 1 [Octopus sinensis]|nr:SHC-transforming protein 1 [Octopus sinensis]
MERQWKKGNKIFGNNNDWNRTNSFMNKPEDGWLHRDEQLCSDAGVCYGVRYLGCLEVKESMRTLDFETRTNLAREAINRITEAAGLKFLDRKKKSDKKVLRILGGYANLRCSGSNITLTITTEALKLVIMENGKVPVIEPFETCLLNESMTQPPPPAPAPEESLQAAMINKDEIPAVLAPVYEEWYHGPLSRKEAELLLEHEGDFLVRESTTTQGQFVLSGRHSAGVKHLLLIDPEGVVRTKDCKFDSISHLVNYHKDNHFPILTQGTELHLLEPVVCNK